MPSVASSPIPLARMAHPSAAPSAVQVMAAWCMLAIVDVLIGAGGFGRVVGLLRRFHNRAPAADEHSIERAATVCAAIERARLFYPRRAWCLQAAAASTILLRLNGVTADIVLGVRCIPFRAHAWVEVEGRVVINEEPGWMGLYSVIERC